MIGFPSDPSGATDLGDLLSAMVDAGQAEDTFDGLGDPNAELPDARTPYDWLTRDPDEVDRYIADPFCGDDNPLTYGYLADLFDVVAPAIERLSSITCPVLIIAGDHDPAAGMGAHASDLADALSAADVTTAVKLYPGARHEVLNETDGDEVTSDLISWLCSHL